MHKKQNEQVIPLCVDLDGTLVKTDMLLETAILLLKSNPLYIFLLPFWLLRGKAYMKHQIARRVKIDVSRLPFNKEFLSFLYEQHESDRTLVLATATDYIIAKKIADYLGLFNIVIGSDCKTNLKGKNKAQILSKQFGTFDYIGNSVSDLEVWEKSKKAIVVNPAPALINKLKKNLPNIQKFGEEGTNGKIMYPSC